jgi:hypothetical protein
MIMNVKYKLSIPSILALFTLVAFTSTVNGQNKPNVVIMLGDNVGYGDIGAYGAGEVRGMLSQGESSILSLCRFHTQPLSFSVRSGVPGKSRIGNYGDAIMEEDGVRC